MVALRGKTMDGAPLLLPPKDKVNEAFGSE